MIKAKLFHGVIITLMIILAQGPIARGQHNISHITVKSWANRLGGELGQLGKYVAQVETLQKSYKLAEVKLRDGNALVQEIAKDVAFMMESKISAVKRIMDVAESLAENAEPYNKTCYELKKDPENSTCYKYNNAKDNKLEMTYSTHFGRPVNLSNSNFHIPTNVYNQAMNVVQAIIWAEKLNTTFLNNYHLDPSLSWQYFGSATGFMTQYPAMNWTMDPVDLYDCRTRNWYIEAATSPKDILILVDSSGSMTGIRKEIAKHVVDSILDTLGNNDFVNIITFSNGTNFVVPCFENVLVQANLANIRELKIGMKKIDTDMIANFSLVLDRAFELLKDYRTKYEGARCNQAIMLITDGVPENYKETFKKYNWMDNPDDPNKADMPVRVFTYLIGREVADTRDVKWMACANRGYYVHLSTMAEVSEKVLNYVPVMARPLVLRRTDHPVIWTPIYADVTDPKMTDYLWDQRLRKLQRERVKSYRRNATTFLMREEQARKLVKRHKRMHDQDLNTQAYSLMTSVSVPVFNRRPNAVNECVYANPYCKCWIHVALCPQNITEQVLVNEAYWVTRTRETRIAELLGVAGIDVPIAEIEKLMLPHMLGVNGYAFIVTNNGFILTHPDLRPALDNILKPAYNSVDMAEVELVDQGNGPRDFGPGLLTFREAVINRVSGSVILPMKYHYDDMQRVGRVKRKYHFMGIDNTPFTVVVALPEHDHGGSYRVHAIEEIHRYQHEKNKAVTDYFSGSNWRVHPDWTYCGYHYEDEHRFNTSEQELLHFLNRTRQAGWKWMDYNRVGSQPPEHSHGGSSRLNASKVDKASYYCDRNLLLSLVYDAKVTASFANASTTRKEEGKEFQQRFGFTLAFMATHSGLTRWQDFPIENETQPEQHFGKLHPRATDEVWYKRAVEQHYVQPDSFVFSVPIDEAGANNDTLVTASHAIFIGNAKMKAPAAVVGFQFKHSRLQGLFRNITYSCEDNCSRSCENDTLSCYLVDNNGYVIAGKNAADAGKFFGVINSFVMRSLVKEGIFDEITVYDYQAVCDRDEEGAPSHGSILLTPLRTIQRAAGWFLGQLAWAWAKTGIWSSAEYAYAYSYQDDDEENQEEEEAEEEVVEEDEAEITVEPRTLGVKEEESSEGKHEKNTYSNVSINRTRLETCDHEIQLYLLQNVSWSKYNVNSTSDCERSYVVQPVDFSNMILVVVDMECEKKSEVPLTVMPKEVTYVNASSLACHKVNNILARRRPTSCIRNHTKEREIQDLCGGALPGLRVSVLPMLLPILLSTWSSILSILSPALNLRV